MSRSPRAGWTDDRWWYGMDPDPRDEEIMPAPLRRRPTFFIGSAWDSIPLPAEGFFAEDEDGDA